MINVIKEEKLTFWIDMRLFDSILAAGKARKFIKRKDSDAGEAFFFLKLNYLFCLCN